MTQEIRSEDLDTQAFITEKSAEIAGAVGEGCALNALSGGTPRR